MHCCEKDSEESDDRMCFIYTLNSELQHKCLPDSGMYQVGGRKEGYPPRQAYVYMRNKSSGLYSTRFSTTTQLCMLLCAD